MCAKFAKFNLMIFVIFMGCWIFDLSAKADQPIKNFSITYDEGYAISITDCHYTVGKRNEKNDDKWTVYHFFSFDNGLEGLLSTDCNSFSEVENIVRADFSGNVNILFFPTDGSWLFDFLMVLQNGTEPFYLSVFCDTGINMPAPLLPRISSISPMEVESGRYIIQLDDGSRWLTNKEPLSPWITNWKVDSRVVIIGNTQQSCFINYDETYCIDHERLEFLSGLQRL